MEETKEEQGEEAEEERGERPRLVMMRRMESETTSYDWSTDSESLRSDTNTSIDTFILSSFIKCCVGTKYDYDCAIFC